MIKKSAKKKRIKHRQSSPTVRKNRRERRERKRNVRYQMSHGFIQQATS